MNGKDERGGGWKKGCQRGERWEEVTEVTEGQPDGASTWKRAKAHRIPPLAKGAPLRRVRGWNL